jgi:hypothetical protein
MAQRAGYHHTVGPSVRLSFTGQPLNPEGIRGKRDKGCLGMIRSTVDDGHWLTDAVAELGT